MRLRASIAAAALACAAPLAAQDVPRGPRLLQVVASSGGVVLSLDSATIARTGDSTFVADAVFQFPADSTQQVAADRQVDSHELDCAGMRLRGRSTMFYLGDVPVPVSTDSGQPSSRWEPVGEEELPIVQALCQYLLSSFAASLPVTLEAWSADEAPELLNRADIAHALARNYPRLLRDAGVAGQAMMRIRISAEGRVDRATIRTLWATRPEFAAAAVQVLERMRFRPGRLRGAPVAIWANLPVSFQLWSDGIDHPNTPDRGPTGSPLWGGRPANPTRDIHPIPGA